MSFFGISPTDLATFINVVTSSIVVILAFSVLAYTVTYNIRNEAARYFIIFLICIVIAYSGEVALNRVVTAGAANIWLRVQWLGIAMLPWAYYVFSRSVVRQTNADVRYGREISIGTFVLSLLAALNGFLGTQLVGTLYFQPPLSFLDSGPYFWFFATYFVIVLLLSLINIYRARQNCLTEGSRKRMNYLLFGFVAPGIGIFPYLIVLGTYSVNTTTNALIFLLALAGNLSVAVFLVLMSYTVAYFGVLTPDRVVRYRLIRFFTRGPIVAILVIIAIQTVPQIERVLGLPRDIVLFSVITGVIICSQILLSTTKTLVDRIVYREDLDEAAWLRELDRRLLTTSDLRQFLENNLTALCELLQAPGGFVAAVVGSDLILEAMVGDNSTLDNILGTENWSDVLVSTNLQNANGKNLINPVEHAGFWVWPLTETTNAGASSIETTNAGFSGADGHPSANSDAKNGTNAQLQNQAGVGQNGQEPAASNQTARPDFPTAAGILAVIRDTSVDHVDKEIHWLNGSKLSHQSSQEKQSSDNLLASATAILKGTNGTKTRIANGAKNVLGETLFSEKEGSAIAQMLEQTSRALADRKLQKDVFDALRHIIPEMDRMQEMRSAATYIGSNEERTDKSSLLSPSPIHSPEFNGWVKDALSHYWGGPKLTRSPLTQLRVVNQALERADNDPTKALRLVLGSAIERLKPNGKEELNKPEWLLYNIVSMRFIEGKKVREIANRLAMSESDLYRKQRVAIGQVARLITEMEQGNET